MKKPPRCLCMTIILCSCFTSAVFAGEKTSVKTNFEMRFDQLKGIKTILVVLPPERIVVNGIDFMGNAESNNELSNWSESMVRENISKGLTARGIHAVFYEYGDLQKKNEILDIYNLGGIVAQSLQTHTDWYDPVHIINMQYIANAKVDFDYSLGDVSKLMDKNNADGVLLFYFTGLSEKAFSNFVSGTALLADRDGNILTMFSRWARDYDTFQLSFDICFNPFWNVDIWNRKWETLK